MEGLNMSNILSEEDVELLFSDEGTTETKQESSPESEDKDKDKTETTEELNIEGLFEETPESVGSEEHQEGEDTITKKETGSSSPTNNFYSSIAKALKDDGVLPDLDDDAADNIKGAEDFAEMIEQQLQLKFDEKQKRIDRALNVGVEDNVIRQYEQTLAYLDSITEDKLSAESDQGEALRRQIIGQDLLNRGYSQEDAKEELNEIFESGNDIKRAKRALSANKEFFKKSYQKVVDDAEEERENDEKERRKQAEALKKSILEDKQLFGELQLDKTTRQRIFDNISRPVYKDKETGELFTAIQKYEMENKTEFLKNVGIIYTLTDGFKNLDGLVKNKVKKEVRKGLRELEHTLNNTSINSDGSLKLVSGVGEDSEASPGRWTIDI